METETKNNITYVTLNNYYNKPKFQNKTILITGGSSGIGYATAKLCIEEGAKVIITGRNIEKLKTAQEKLGTNAFISQFDMADTKAIDSKFDLLYEKFGVINHLVCNAGCPSLKKGFNDIDEEEWERIMSVHLRGNYFLMRKFYNAMLFHNLQGNIVAVSSNGAFCGHLIPYGIAKAGLNNYIKGLAKISIERGIRCNGVAPGYTVTNIFDERGTFPGLSADGNLYKGDIRGKRFHLPEEIAGVILFLLSDASSSINGQIIKCDSGDTIL